MQTKEYYENIIKECFSKTDFAKKLGFNYYNGRASRFVSKIIEENNLSITHFDGGNSKKIKYPIIIKKCPVCEKEFEAQFGSKREKQTCSYGCANKLFRSGENNGMWKNDTSAHYTKICFRYHEKKCIICEEDKIVAVHHFDHNHENNDPKNLVPLCLTHHSYIHSKHKDLIIEKVNAYVNNFRGIA